MMPTDRFERQLPVTLTDLAEPRTPDYLDDLLWQTAHTSQRPAWSFLERWLPVVDIARQSVHVPQIPWRSMGVGIALLALLLAMIAALVIGSHKPLPSPFGPARNGPVAFESNGDIYTADPITGEATAIMTGPELDFNPKWSLDGTGLAFERRAAAGRGQVVVANADGTDQTIVTPEPLYLNDYSFSPNGQDILISVGSGSLGEILLANTDGSGVRTLDVGIPASEPQWRPPDGAEILFVNQDARLHAVDPVSGQVRTVSPYSAGTARALARWSPDGSAIAYTGWSITAAALSARVHIVAADGSNDRMLPLAEGAVWQGDQFWSNDGSRLLAARGYTGTYEDSVAVVLPVDGRGTGLEIDYQGVLNQECCSIWEWAPDDSWILGTPADAAGGQLDQVLIDPVNGTVSAVPWASRSRPSWQRLSD
jgi:Tol biopolymer transport system component